jgi:hypothetical protein
MRDIKPRLSLVPSRKESTRPEKPSALEAECFLEIAALTEDSFARLHQMVWQQDRTVILSDQPAPAQPTEVSPVQPAAADKAMQTVASSSYLDDSRAKVANAYSDSKEPYAPAA